MVKWAYWLCHLESIVQSPSYQARNPSNLEVTWSLIYLPLCHRTSHIFGMELEKGSLPFNKEFLGCLLIVPSSYFHKHSHQLCFNRPKFLSSLSFRHTYEWHTIFPLRRFPSRCFLYLSSFFSPQKKNLLGMSQLLLFDDIKILRTRTFVRVYSQTRISSLTIHALNMIQEQEVAITKKKSWKQSMEDNIWKYP